MAIRETHVETRPEGLTSAEVKERISKGETNQSHDRTSRTLGEIIRANVFTRFNAILAVLLAAVITTGEYKDGLFGIVLVFNALIGIVQEIKAKRTLDRLAVLSASGIKVVRDGTLHELAPDALVLDDIVQLGLGDQVPADGVVLEAVGLEIDESLLTGEADPIDKERDAKVMSGSFVVAGVGRIQTTAVGDDAYAHRLAAEVKKFSLVQSELSGGINRVLMWVTWATIPAAVLLGYSQFSAVGGWSHAVESGEWRHAVAGVVAGLVAIIPQGLVLITSIAFGLAAITLARRNCLVQELPAVEVLARVDVVCLDKTGTLTEGDIVFDSVRVIEGEPSDVDQVLGLLGADPAANATASALAEHFSPPVNWEVNDRMAFSSARKWSAIETVEYGSWYFGAPEMVLAGLDPSEASRLEASELAATGQRVLVLAHRAGALTGDEIQGAIRPRAFVLFREKVRTDAAETLAYFKEQGVALKVISGDNPRTVAAVARAVGFEVTDGFDARNLPEEIDAVADILETHSVFGRVSPHQKRLMVKALQSRGHVVAMTGDGVNDALALKDADLGIAMGNGAAATKATAQLVLLDGKFSTMPGVVAEGRRVIANVERVANLFMTKTVWALLFAVVVGVGRWQYPLLPRHLTLVDSLVIGIPSFVIALAPNLRRYVPGFLSRVVRFVVPTGLVIGTATSVTYAIARNRETGSVVPKTTAVLVLTVLGLWVLTWLARPLTRGRVALVLSMAALGVAAVAIPYGNEFFQLDVPGARTLAWAALCTGAAVVMLEVYHRRALASRTS